MKQWHVKNFDLGYTIEGIRNVLIKRMASPYQKYQKFLEESQWWSHSQLREHQIKQLQQLVRIAYYQTPYYRKIMDSVGFNPSRISSAKDICELPILEKDDIRLHHREMVANSKNYAMLYKCNTSGTTGKPLTLYRDLENVGYEHALLMRQWKWAGLEPTDRYATIKGDLISNKQTECGTYWSFSVAENKLYMSSYHLSEENADRYIAALKQYRPLAIEGYPSSVYALARFVIERGVQLSMKAVLTTSETLSTEQRLVIEKAFDCRVFDYYGMAERVAAIHTCEFGRYHLVPEYGVVEFVNRDYLSDDCYEIVGTSLNNMAMPLIRYRVGDIVQPSNIMCPCGRSYPVIRSIVGRRDDYIVTPSGKLIGRLDHIFKGANNLVEAQLFQPDKERVVLRIVPDRCYDETLDGNRILQKLHHRLGERMRIDIENVTSIPRNGRGKFKAVVSEVNGFAA